MRSFNSIDEEEILNIVNNSNSKNQVIISLNVPHNGYNFKLLNNFLYEHNINKFINRKLKNHQINYKYYCSICNEGFNFKTKIIEHYVKQHNLSQEEAIKQFYFYDKGIEFPKCPYCGKDVTLCRHIPRQTCSNPECRGKHNSKRQKEWYKNHPEEKEKRSKQRVEYLKNKQNFEKTAWGKRASGKMSFLERWFVDNVIIPYKLGDKFDIIYDYNFSKYFLDFAFENIKLDVELDGRCHFNNGIERIQHDINRDKYLIENNWKVYRISYKDVEKHSEETIKNFINFLNNYTEISPKQYNKNDFIKIKFYVSKRQKERFHNWLNKEREKWNKFNLWLEKLNNSNIDFSKFGWKSKCYKLLNCTQKEFKYFDNLTDFSNNYKCKIFNNMKGSLGQRWILDNNGNRKRIKNIN